MLKSAKSIPVIDLFAGPGGLGEGFSAYAESDLKFRIKLSIEKDPAAHKTLLLRSFYRQFSEGNVPQEYYQYVSGASKMPLEKLISLYPQEWDRASHEAWLAELGAKDFPNHLIDKRISSALNGAKEWVLIGGPPCQAYSVLGRWKRNANLKAFEKDHRHFLYKQYLRILTEFQPSIFIMENVKGILSSKIDDQFIFHRILKDLKNNGKYTIYSLSSATDNPEHLKPRDFIVQTEEYGVPQARHRVILVGVRNDIGFSKPSALKKSFGPSVHSVISDLPRLKSRISRIESTEQLWRKIILKGSKIIVRSNLPNSVKRICRAAIKGIPPEMWRTKTYKKYGSLEKWLKDAKIETVLNHEARGHMASDIQRYFFAACYAAALDVSPRLNDFPRKLLPKHQNIIKTGGKTETFNDRFKVQLGSKVSSTIVSHIAKDGHYYIHPDPTQCRSLTVREAARLQTFPDNYFFEGNRTQQYTQVGNAVPPFLAVQIAGVVAKLIEQKNAHKNEKIIKSVIG